MHARCTLNPRAARGRGRGRPPAPPWKLQRLRPQLALCQMILLAAARCRPWTHCWACLRKVRSHKPLYGCVHVRAGTAKSQRMQTVRTQRTASGGIADAIAQHGALAGQGARQVAERPWWAAPPRQSAPPRQTAMAPGTAGRFLANESWLSSAQVRAGAKTLMHEELALPEVSERWTPHTQGQHLPVIDCQRPGLCYCY